MLNNGQLLSSYLFFLSLVFEIFVSVEHCDISKIVSGVDRCIPVALSLDCGKVRETY